MKTVQISGGIKLKPCIKGSWAQALREGIRAYGESNIPSVSAYARYMQLNGYSDIVAKRSNML